MTSPYENMIAVLYVRTSTDDKGQIPAMQMEDMERWCKQNKVNIADTFIDEGYTGGNLQRPGMMSMLGFLAMNKVHIVLAQDCTRISRDNDDMEHFLQIIKPFGTVLRYTTTNINPEDELEKMINYMATSQGEQWRKQHVIKVKKGLKYAQAHGTKSGRSIGRPKIDIDLDLAMECADNGYSVAKASDVLGCSRVTLHDHLKRSDLLNDYYSRCRKTSLSEKTDLLNTLSGKQGTSIPAEKDIVSDNSKEVSDSKDGGQ